MKDTLTPEIAAKLYRDGRSACEIASAYRVKLKTAEHQIRLGGLNGLQWCPPCRRLEVLKREY